MTQTVNILGVPFAVRLVSHIPCETGMRSGQIDTVNYEIQIRDSMPREATEIVLLHEVVHGILMSLKYFDESDNEQLVQGLAIGLYQALKGQNIFS